MTQTHFDMIIVGAGLSGIGAAYHFQEKCPGKSYAILEARGALGGTWDLFRYPGIRSDSDMHTLGYNFKPWTERKAIADGPSILSYVEETAQENGIDKNIRYNHKVIAAHWSTPEALWTLEIEIDGKPSALTCNFLFMCAGYYDYDQGHTPNFQGRDSFEGRIIHPQKWPEGLDYKNKRVVIIGSGATAVTLVPNMAKDTQSMTMLQRSPTYMIAFPDKDWLANLLRKILPDQWAYNLVRKKNIWRQLMLYQSTRTKPQKVKDWLLKRARKELGTDYDIETHFTPSYNPWDQRMCLIPNADLYKTIRSGKAAVVTDHIEKFTKTGIELKSGNTLDADIIITATGLNLVVFGGMDVFVDSKKINFADHFSYEAMMLSDVPNLVSVFGYVNASWTLRADIIAEYVCRLINHMDEIGMRQATPRAPSGMTAQPWINFDAGYIQRVIHQFPKQGDREPWLNTQNYKRDKKALRESPIDDGHMQFSNPAQEGAKAAAE